MTDYFFDSSALVKRYVREVGTAWVIAITNPSPTDAILLTDVNRAEVAAAVAAKQRAPQGISLAARNRALGRFLQDCKQQFLIFQTDSAVVDLAVDLTQRYRLRGYDAVQVAAAFLANRDFLAGGRAPLVLVSADSDLLLAAQGEGLATDNPLNPTRPLPSP